MVRRAFPLTVPACAAVALGCGAADPQVEPRFVAVHNALVASGMVQSGPIQRGSLGEGQDHRLVTELEGGRCHTLVALGSGRVRDLDLRVRGEGGEDLARDTTEDRQAAVRVCPERSGEYQILVRMKGGSGSFVLGSWSGPAEGGVASADSVPGSTGPGSCAGPLPLELDEPVQGDTRRGRSLLSGSCGRGEASEQVYRMELPARAQVSLSVRSGYDAVLYVQGTCGDSESEVACNDDAERNETGRSEVDVTLDAGTWFVIVDGYREEAGDYELSASVSELRPVAEVCKDASELRAGRATSGSTSGAADQFQASCAGGARSPDRVYEIDVPQKARMRVRQRSDHDGVLYVRRQCERPASELACNDDLVDPRHSVVHLVAEPGTHYVYTDGFSGRGRTSEGPFTLTAELGPADGSGIPGDTCADAERAPLGRAIELDTFAAHDDLAGSCGGTGAPDVVYQLDVKHRSRLRARMHASEFTGVMYVRDRCDDRGSEKGCVKVKAASPRDRVTSLDAVLGSGTHHLVVDGEDQHAFGAAEIEIGLTDLGELERACQQAPMLRPGRQESGSTASEDDDFQGGCMSAGGGPDRVYRLRLRRRARVAVELSSRFDGAVYLRGDCVDRATELACNDDHRNNRHSRVEKTLDAGLYYVIVDGFRGDQSGDFDVEVSAETSPLDQ